VQKNKEKILVITYWSYNDALIQTYTLPYLNIISTIITPDSKIFLVTLDKDSKQEKKSESKIETISFRYKDFGFGGLFMWMGILLKLIRLIRKEKITTIHTWCTPAGAIGYLLSVLTGRKLIIDSFEPHAVPMIESGTWKKSSLAFKILFKLEKLQLKRAQEVICACEGMIEYSKNLYGISKKRYFTKPACTNLDLFSIDKIKIPYLVEELHLKDKITCVYAGKFGGLYLEKETFDFFKVAADYWGDKFQILLLTSHSDEEIANYLKQVNLSPKHIIKKFVPHHQIPEYIGLADFAFCPMKPIRSRRFSTPIKNGEYWAMGLPIVITKNISDDSDIIEANNIGSVLEELNITAYKKSVEKIDELLNTSNGNELRKKIRSIAERYRNFEIAQKVYSEIY
jgi:glycosyltransferase involved in cell wall biosynthesis